MEFKKYQHVERLGTSHVEGLLSGRVYIFPKLDGANASIWMEDGELCCGSRNMKLDVHNTLNGFYQYVMKHEGIREFMRNFPHLTLYGEWLTPHTIKNYNSTAWYQFYLFDVVTESGQYIDYQTYYMSTILDGILTLSPLTILDNPTLNDVINVAERNEFLMESGHIGEGVVCKRYNYANPYGKVVWGKYVRPAFKMNHVSMKTDSSNLTLLEQRIANDAVTYELVQKEKAKLLSNGNFTGNIIPATMSMVWECLISEELHTALKKHKNPKLDFRVLNRACNEIVREHLGVN